MVNNRATYQRQSWIPDAHTAEQAVFIPTVSDENHLVPAICRIWGLQPLIPFLQCVNWLGLRFVL